MSDPELTQLRLEIASLRRSPIIRYPVRTIVIALAVWSVISGTISFALATLWLRAAMRVIDAIPPIVP